MQDPKAIIEPVKRGAVPAAWSVTRPRGGYPLLAAARAVFATLALIFLLGGFASLAVVFVSNAAPGGIGQIERLNAPQAYGVPVIAGAVAVALVVAVIAGIRAIGNAPWSWLVFTPEGLVQSLGPAAIVAVDFAAIDQITRYLRIDVRANQSGGSTWSTSSTRMYATLHYRTGRTVRWRPNWRFGADQAIVERLVNGHERYRALVSPGSNPY